MRTYSGITLNHLDPKDPAFVDALRSGLNEINKWILAAQRELSPTQGGSLAAEGASVDEPYVVATATSGLNNERVLAGVSPIGVSDGGAGGNISVLLTGQVPVASGGTGAATAADARANLNCEAITVNSSALVDMDLDDATPAAPAAGVNVKWQKDASSPANVSAYTATAAPSSMTFSTIAGDGTATSLLRTDAQLPIFSGSAPQSVSIGGSNATGSTAKAARIDHVHKVDVDIPIDTLSSTDSGGAASTLLRSDCTIRSATSASWLNTAANKGQISKDTQGSPRYWEMYVEKGATTPVSGDCTITIDSAGNISATRGGGAAGDITIVIKDLGTTIPF